MARRCVVQIRLSDEEHAVLRANAGQEGVGPYLRRLGLEGGPVMEDPAALMVEMNGLREERGKEGKRTVSDRVANSGRPSGQAGSTPAPSVPKPLIPPPADEDSGGSDVPVEEPDSSRLGDSENVVPILKCPRCEFRAPSPKATCPAHGYRVR